MMENELEELKELSIAKIKVAYNRSVDLEATHLVLWDKSDKRMKIKIIITIILCLITASSLIIAITFSIITELMIFISVLVLLMVVLAIWEGFQRFSEDHGRIVNEALQLREQSISFLQYKLDNLDKQGYIDELKSLEIIDTTLKDKSAKYTKKLSSTIVSAIDKKIEDLKRQGIKKYFMTQEEIDSATEKLQKYTALRTCEAWIKFT